jgi:hypothetical protein
VEVRGATVAISPQLALRSLSDAIRAVWGRHCCRRTDQTRTRGRGQQAALHTPTANVNHARANVCVPTSSKWTSPPGPGGKRAADQHDRTDKQPLLADQAQLHERGQAGAAPRQTGPFLAWYLLRPQSGRGIADGAAHRCGRASAAQTQAIRQRASKNSFSAGGAGGQPRLAVLLRQPLLAHTLFPALASVSRPVGTQRAVVAAHDPRLDRQRSSLDTRSRWTRTSGCASTTTRRAG